MTSSVSGKRKQGEDSEELRKIKERLSVLKKEREDLEHNIILIRSVLDLLK